MEAGQIEISSSNGNPATPPAHALIPRADPTAPNSSAKKKKKKLKVNNPIPHETTKPPSVSSCYVFKSRLQEYAQKAGLTTPVYETLKEGPSHEPSFKSTVIVNNVRYDSLPGFFNRKAAEQSAAEVALVALSNSVDMKFGISAPVHETGLCKNLLQEYAQKMNYAIPLYECHKEENQGRMAMYSCTAEIGGIRYIGAAASTKKEAEIKAARTALLAIQSAATNPSNDSTYTVVPQKKKGSDLGISTQETSAALKPKKGRFKKQQQRKHWRALKRLGQGVLSGGSEVNMDGRSGVKSGDANMDGCVGVKSGGGLEINMDGRVGVESVVSEGVSSQHNTADGTGVNTDGGLVKATSVVGSQGTDPGVGRVETTSSSGVCIGNPENALVACNERRPKDAQSLTMDVHP